MKENTREIKIIPGTMDIDDLLTLTAEHMVDHAIKNGIIKNEPIQVNHTVTKT